MLHEVNSLRFEAANDSLSSIGRQNISIDSVSNKTGTILHDQNLSGMSGNEMSFAAISDGGFHKGYWKAKYLGGEDLISRRSNDAFPYRI